MKFRVISSVLIIIAILAALILTDAVSVPSGNDSHKQSNDDGIKL